MFQPTDPPEGHAPGKDRAAGFPADPDHQPPPAGRPQAPPGRPPSIPATATTPPAIENREARAAAFLHEIESLSDDELLVRLRGMVVRERRSTTRLLAHLAVIDARRLYTADGYSSLFNYCTRGLHFSEQAAYLRIEAARVVRRFPAVLARVADGSIHLTALSLLRKHLTAANHRRLLDAARHRTRREIEDLVAVWRTTPAGPSRARFDTLAPPAAMRPWAEGPARSEESRLPFGGESLVPDEADADSWEAEPAAGWEDGRSDPGGLETDDVRHESDVTPVMTRPGGSAGWFGTSRRAPDRPDGGRFDQGPRLEGSDVDGLTSRGSATGGSAAGASATGGEPVYRLHITIPAGTRRKLDRAAELLRHQIPDGDPALIIDRALGVLLDRLEQRKFARVMARPEPNVGVRPADLPVTGMETGPEGPASSDPGDGLGGRGRRPIPAAVRREVWRRDGGRCAFVGAGGRRCDQVGWLEYHHRVPWARGGTDTVGNLELRCRAHNELERETDFGRHARGTDAIHPADVPADGGWDVNGRGHEPPAGEGTRSRPSSTDPPGPGGAGRPDPDRPSPTGGGAT
jgi:hypothetical protein